MADWISVNAACEALNCYPNAVLYQIKKNTYFSRQVPNPNGGRGGFKYEIALESLPQEAQQRYWQQVRIAQEQAVNQPKRGRPSKAVKQAQEAAKAAKQAEIQANAIYAEAPAWQKQTVDQRLQVVRDTLGMGRKELTEWIETHALDLSVAT
ncbi:hypothetical protein IJT93_07600, partial [bacterium]|nr:hypothetical protein [bacterium]